MPHLRSAEARSTPSTGSAPRLRVTGTLAALAAVTLVITGCAPQGAKIDDTMQVQMHPTGNLERGWMSNAYANGVENTYATANELCGVSDGVAIEFVETAAAQGRVVARDLATSTIKWQLPDTRCSSGALLNGGLLIYSDDRETFDQWKLVDPVRGAELQSFELGGARYWAEQMGMAGELRVINSAESVLGLGPQGLEWQFSKTEFNFNSYFVLGDGRFALQAPEGKFAVLNGNTGELQLEDQVESSLKLNWASDGYVLLLDGSSSTPVYGYFDLEGNQTGEGSTGVPYLVPRDYRGITFPLNEAVSASGILAVDAEGAPVLFAQSRKIKSPVATFEDLNGSTTDVQGVSESGQTFLTSSTDGPGYTFIDTSGEAIFTWPLDSSELTFESGYVVIRQGNMTYVLVPKPQPKP